MPSNATARESLDALLAMVSLPPSSFLCALPLPPTPLFSSTDCWRLSSFSPLPKLRAPSPSELLDATQRLNNAIGSSGDEASADDGDSGSGDGTPPNARAVVASDHDDMAPLHGLHGHHLNGGEGGVGPHSYAPHVSSRLSALGQQMDTIASLPTPRLAEALPSARYFPELGESLPNSAVGSAMHQWGGHSPAPDTPGYGINVADLLTPNSAL